MLWRSCEKLYTTQKISLPLQGWLFFSTEIVAIPELATKENYGF